MKKKKTLIYIGVAAAVILAAAGICFGIYAWRVSRVNTMVDQQNYLASRMLEMGQYEQGRMLAAQCEQMKENKVSEELLVLAAGFQADYEVGIRYTDKYRGEEGDQIIESAGKIYREVTEMLALVSKEDRNQYNDIYNAQLENVREKLLPLLLQVQNSISVKKTGENMLAMLNVMTGEGVTAEALALLEDDNSLMARKVQLSYAIQTGDYEEAYVRAEDMLKVNGSFENRALLANLAVKQGNTLLKDERTDKLVAEQESLRAEQEKLQTQYFQETSAVKQDDISQRIESVQAKIDSIQQEIDAIPAQKAINFIETTTPVRERETVAYKIELSRLYYQAAEREKARDLLLEVIQGDAESETLDLVGLMFYDFLNGYVVNNGSVNDITYVSMENVDIGFLWNRIAAMLNFLDTGYEEENSYYDFVLNTLNQLYNGLIIRQIDATAFPKVRVTVNVSMELEAPLKKENFTLEELGAALTDFELLNVEELEETGDMAVALVVDRSGSMSGSRMEDTKKAVTNFVRTIDENIEAGLIAFESDATVITPVGNGRNNVLQGINSLDAGGGTNIYAGLKLAGQELDGKSGRKVIILLSDGEDGNAGMIDEVLDDLKRRNIYVYTIGVGGADTEYLSYIARKCDGKFIQADTSEVLGEIYSAIGQYMVNDYVIEFTVTQSPEEFSRYVKVTVDVDDAFAEREYHVGVSYDEIESQRYERPLADYFQQVGGSWTEPEPGTEE